MLLQPCPQLEPNLLETTQRPGPLAPMEIVCHHCARQVWDRKVSVGEMTSFFDRCMAAKYRIGVL